MSFDAKLFTQYATDKLLEYCLKNNIKTLVTGISGGLDSAVVAALTEIVSDKSKLEIKNIGISLPCKIENYKTEYSETIYRSDLVGRKFSDPFYHKIDISHLAKFFRGTFLALSALFVDIFPVDYPKQLIAKGNVIARIRMIILYYIANMTNGIVMSTDNYSELLTGFWTKHGDEGDYGLIQYLWKGSELRELAKYLGVPKEIIDAKPTDGLGVSEGGDEAQLGAPYEKLDEVLNNLLCLGMNPNSSTSFIETYGSPDCTIPEASLYVNTANRVAKTSFKRTPQPTITRIEMKEKGII